MIQDQDIATGPTELSPDGRKALEDLFLSIMREEQTDRRQEVRKAAQNRFFSLGIQHLKYDSTQFMYIAPEASGEQLPRYMDVYNIYTPHQRSITSVLSQSTPGINFQPDDLQQSRDITGASYAEKYRARVDRQVAMDDRQAEIADNFCTDGRTVTWTRIDKEGKLRISVHGVLESKVPIYQRDIKNWGYSVISFERDMWEAKDEYPDYAEDITATDGTAEGQYEKFMRLGILSNRRNGQVDGMKNLTTEHHAWVRPGRFRKTSEKVRTELAALYPEGVHMTVISGKCVDAEPMDMEAQLRVDWSRPGKGASRPSLLNDIIPLQMALNDHLNELREHVEFSIPATWIAEDSVDGEALSEQKSAPGVIHLLRVPNGSSINDLIFQEQVAQLPSELVQNIDRLLQMAQFISGDLPSLYGDGTPDQDTYQGQKMLSDHAKGQFSMAWHGLQRLMAGTYDIAVRYSAQLDSDKDTIAIPGPSGQVQISPAAVLDGNWGCYPNKDSAFPETMADQRASFQNFMTQIGQAGPDGLKIVMHPNNLKVAKQLSGLKDLALPQVDARDKQLREIEQLLRETPIPDEAKIPQWEEAAAQALASGQEPPEQPMTASIPIGKYDFNQYELDMITEWLSSQACFEEQQKGNKLGVENVSLHADLHQQAIAKAAEAAASAAQEPMKISAAFKDLDPATKVQALVRDGYQPDQAAYETQTVVDQQNVSADTQDKAASATHKSVLAAKEAVAPIERKSQVDEVKEND